MYDFVKRNALAIAKSRALTAKSAVESQNVVSLREENGISYFDVSIDENFRNTQAIFFVESSEASNLGLKVAVMVKATSSLGAKNKIEQFKSALQK